MIQYSGVATHNLKGIDFSLEENSIVLLKGCSGSGKSSLAIDTVYRISEEELCQLTNKARPEAQYDIDSYSGIIPAICLQQENYNVNPRSTIGTYFGINSCLVNAFSAECHLSREMFNFNNSDYWCPQCRGLGEVLTPSIIDVVDASNSISKRPFRVWNIGAADLYNQLLVAYCHEMGIPIDVPVKDLPLHQRECLYYGESRNKFKVHYRESGVSRIKTLPFRGVVLFLKEIISNGGLTSSNRGFFCKETCLICKGGRLSADFERYKVFGRTFREYQTLAFEDLAKVCGEIASGKKGYAANQFDHILRFVSAAIEMRLGYLNLNRSIPSLSGGELQRLFTAKAGISHFNGFLYIFDEPLSALHPSEIGSIVDSIKRIRANGNTVLAVDHSSALEVVADKIVCLGPGSGKDGGRIVKEQIPSFDAFVSSVRPPFFECKSYAHIEMAAYNNVDIRNLDLPMGSLVGVCGISGSGKTSFARHILPHVIPGLCYVNQEPIRGNSYSTVATALGVMRDLVVFWAGETQTQLSNYDYMHKGRGQCKMCSGTGRVVEKSADYVTETICPECHGARYSKATLRIKWKGLNIREFLDKSIDEIIEILPPRIPVIEHLRTAARAGLGYLKLSQKTETLSGGEAQRIKIVARITHTNRGHAYALDEPFRGVDPQNAEKLLRLILDKVEGGASVFIVEHNPAILSCCSYIIEFGPGSGRDGGRVVYCGERSRISSCGCSQTKDYLIG